MGKLLVRDLMTEQVFSVQPDEDVEELYNIMADKHVRHVPVVDSEGTLIGIVSHRDLIGSVFLDSDVLPMAEQRDLFKAIKVEEIMHRGADSSSPDDSIDEAGRIMLEGKLGCLPVTEGDKLVGILTEADFVKYLVDHSQA